MEDIVRKLQKRKRDQGTDDNGSNEIKEQDLEVKYLFRSNLLCRGASKTRN